jgi:hypothetical protein
VQIDEKAREIKIAKEMTDADRIKCRVDKR